MKTARVKWIENFKFMGEAPSGKSIMLDAPVDSGGDGSAVTPGELTIVSLGGCTGIDVVGILKKMRVDFDSFEVVVNAVSADEHPKVWVKLEVKYIISGKNIDESKVKKAIDLTTTKYCSVSAMLSKTAEMTFDYEIINK